MKRTDEDLALAYTIIVNEFESLERAYYLKQTIKDKYHAAPSDERYYFRCLANDQITLFCVSTRKLLCFFNEQYKNSQDSDDVRVTDFDLSYSIFQNCKLRNYSEITKRVNKEIAHFTYKQITDFELREWDFSAIFEGIKEHYGIFKLNMETFNKHIVDLSLRQSIIFQNQLFSHKYEE